MGTADSFLLSVGGASSWGGCVCASPQLALGLFASGEAKKCSGPRGSVLGCQNFTKVSKVRGFSEFQCRKEALFRGSSLSVQVFVCWWHKEGWRGLVIIHFIKYYCGTEPMLPFKALWSDFHIDFWLRHRFFLSSGTYTVLITVNTPKPYNLWQNFPNYIPSEAGKNCYSRLYCWEMEPQAG